MSGLAVDVLLGVSPAGAADRARELAAVGVDGVFTFENAHDVFFPLVLAAGAAELDLMTNVAIALPRSPLHLAYSANDLQLLSGGRFRLGLGSQIRPHIEHRYGSTWSAPVERMREWVLAIKAIFAAWGGERLDFRGAYTRHTLMPPAFNPGPNPFGPPPVLLGALGPRMTQMAAEVADGLLVMPFNSARHLRERTVPAIARGLSRRGPAAPLEVVAEAIVAVGRTPEEREAARNGVRWLLAFYGSTPSYRPVLEVEGRADLQPRLNELSKLGAWQEMAALIDDDLVHTIAVAGDPDQCAATIVERFGEHADRVCCYFPGYPLDDVTLAALVAGIGARS